MMPLSFFFQRQITRHFNFTSVFYDVSVFFLLYETTLRMRQRCVTAVFAARDTESTGVR